MFEAFVEFAPSGAVTSVVQTIRRTNLHMHPSALEIVYVLRGALHVKVSCEDFDLRAGDFAVLNRGDPHQLSGSTDNVTAILHVAVAEFTDIDPLVEHIVFACESFDLARYRRQESLLRGLLLDLFDASLPAGGGAAGSNEVARELMRLLCDGYSLENYYNRHSPPTRSQQEKFRTIVRYLWRYAAQRNVLDVIADREHYSKSYVSHLVKDVGAVSFSDLLVYFRVALAETLLLTTKRTMLEIASACGFSDVKYFTRSFVNWFHSPPSEYRKRHQPDILRDSDISSVPAALATDLIRDHRRHVASRSEGPRLSVTPLLLKNLAVRRDQFSSPATAGTELTRTPQSETSSGVAHLVPIQLGVEDLASDYLLDGLDSFDQIDATPCLVLEYSTQAATMELLSTLARRLHAHRSRPAIWLTYGAIHDRSGVDHVVTRARDDHGLQLQPIMLP
jgi:AraC-like DNA-binding protein/mannose-6-phosphate isomerase-like protein (cupin superfamily)